MSWATPAEILDLAEENYRASGSLAPVLFLEDHEGKVVIALLDGFEGPSTLLPLAQAHRHQYRSAALAVECYVRLFDLQDDEALEFLRHYERGQLGEDARAATALSVVFVGPEGVLSALSTVRVGDHGEISFERGPEDVVVGGNVQEILELLVMTD